MRSIGHQMAVGIGLVLGSVVHVSLHGQWGEVCMVIGSLINIQAVLRAHFWMKREIQAGEVEIALLKQGKPLSGEGP